MHRHQATATTVQRASFQVNAILGDARRRPADAEHAEAALYADLVADRLGRSVRLEQERIAFGIIERAMLDCGGA